MIVFGATAIATLACQGCVHVGVANTAQSMPTQVYAVPIMAPTAAAPNQPTITFSGSFQKIEAIERDAFAQVESYSGPIDLSKGHTFASTRLSTNSALLRLASEREQNILSAVPRERRKITAELSLSAPAERTGLGFDVGITPRISFSRDGAFASRRIGGEVRIGQNFDKRGDGEAGNSWYLFAGADGEALVWEPDETGNMSVTDMALRDKVTVGDMQAGVSFQQGPGQISFSYIRREVEYRERNLGASENEDFVGVSFTVKR